MLPGPCAVIDNHGVHRRQFCRLWVLRAVLLPDAHHITQNLKHGHGIDVALMLKKQIEQELFRVTALHGRVLHRIKQVRCRGMQLRVNKAVREPLQCFQVNVLKQLFRRLWRKYPAATSGCPKVCRNT